MSMRTFILAVTGIALSVAACSSYGTSVVETNKPPARVASVSISVPNSLTAGQTARGVAIPKDASGASLTDRPVTWFTSSASIASVTDSGVISAVAPGTAVVSAVSEGVAGQATMAVIPTPTPIATMSVAVSPSSILIGQTARATATLMDSTGSPIVGRPITWQSSNSNVAAIAQTGDVTAVAPGSAMISGSSEGKTASSALTVVAPAPVPVASVSVLPSTPSLQVGGTVQLSAVTRDANNNVLSGRSITWSSSNTTTSTVSASGLVTALAAGSATISASSEGQIGSAAVTINPTAPVPVASVSVSPAASTLQIGGTVQLSAVTRDASSNVLGGRSITWSSNNTAISTVSASGLVTAVTAGSAAITALSEGKSGTATITVTAPPPPAASPSTVTNLNVSAIDSTGATLSFTQVDDGTGQPAKYDVRYAVAPISWGSATAATSGTCATPVAGTAIGSQLTCRVLGLTPSTNYGFQVVAFRGTLNLNAVFGSPSNIASATTTAGTAPPPPPPPPPSGSAEPPGMTAISSRAFNSTTAPNFVSGEDGWWDFPITPVNFTIVTDPTAPQSPPNVAQVRFYTGFPGGNSTGGSEKPIPGGQRTLYVSMWVKLSSNWQGNPSTVNKVIHVWINGLNRVVASATGSGSGALVPQMRLQQLAGGYGPGGYTDVNLNPNIAGQTGATFSRGQWHKWEIVLYGGTAGGANGTLEWWLDGVKVGQYTGIPFVGGGGSNTWEILKFDPTWGGIGGTVPADQFMWMDHFYISGKP